MFAISYRSMRVYAAFVTLSISFYSSVIAEELQLKEPERLSEVLVSSSPLERTLFESAQPVVILSDSELSFKAKGSLGETLASEPGVSSSYFGPGASRPVIRGLGGDRIRILENGIGSQDVSNTSPDHSTAVEPSLAEKIEIVRGPASLLYGTSAIGGVVNVFDGRIPEVLPDRALSGMAELRAASVDKERAGLVSLTVPVGSFAVHVDGFERRTDDYYIPGFARTEQLRQESELEFSEPKNKVPFSATETDNVTLGSSYIFDTGYLGAAISEYNTQYGVPNGENDVSIDGQRRRLDIQGQARELGNLVKSTTVKLGLSNYEHTEFESQETGTVFSQDAFDGRLELAHAALGPIEGIIGFQYQNSDFRAIGEEAFQPPTKSNIYSTFIFEETKLSPELTLQLGGRYDRSEIDSKGFESGVNDNINRSINTFGETSGLVWSFNPDYALALSVAHTERAPSGQELYADGPHVATAAYEVGDSDLKLERSLGVDLTLRKQVGMLRGSIGGFYNHFWDYIALNRDGRMQDEFPVYLFQQVNADFIGFESQLALYVVDEGEREISFDFQPDYVRAQDLDKNQPLERIPPLRMKFGANFYDQSLLRARLEVQHLFDQDRTAELETSSSQYTFLNAYLSKEVPIGNNIYELFARGTNLTDEKARDHVSFIKDITPLPGASVLAGLRVRF